jgi:hypothetical protein
MLINFNAMMAVVVILSLFAVCMADPAWDQAAAIVKQMSVEEIVGMVCKKSSHRYRSG